MERSSKHFREEKEMKSIIQKNKECYVTGRTEGLHKHHIYGGPNRQISEKNGFYIWLTPAFHNLSDKGIHFDKSFDLCVKRACQREYEKTHSREDFMKLIGRNYLED